MTVWLRRWIIAKVTAKEIEAALFRKYDGQQSHWIVLREVTIDDEVLLEELVAAQERMPAWAKSESQKRYYASRRSAAPTKRRIDMLLVSHKNSESVKIKRERIALEIKVSRSDFLSETDEKRGPWRRFADKFAYVAPTGMIKPEELPPGCGLMEYGLDQWGFHTLVWKVRAKAEPNPNRGLEPNFAHYILSRLHTAEAKLRRLAAA